MTNDGSQLRRGSNRVTGPLHRIDSLVRRCALAAFAAFAIAAQIIAPAQAEGSRTLFPLGYLNGEAGNVNPAAARSTLVNNSSGRFMGIIRQQTFFYVYAQTDEYILLGTSGDRSALRLFAPPSAGQTLQARFGVPGLEDVTALGSALTLSGTGCTNNSANIGSRNAELAGPHSADGTATVPNGYAPCYYRVPSGGTGIYGVYFGTAASTEMWDVTVRASVNTLADINGRLFSYAFSGNTGSAASRTYATHYYITDDGYRYSQTFRGLAPYQYMLYSNPKGFLDVNGDPLYKNVRGQGNTLNTADGAGSYFRPSGTGIQAQRPTYPMFFSNVADGSVDTPNGLQATLGALDIPLTPAAPMALSASFSHPYTPGSRTYVGQGGIFTINTQNALTYQIVLKGGSTPAHDDPAHADNRVLTGVATGVNQKVYWDGLNNAGTPMPAGGNYSFVVTGRAGEVHFPFLDAEANLSGGPTVTRLNGPNPGEATVYYDDRGYRTNGVNVGTVGGDICGSGSDTPSPAYSLLGIDSSDANYASTGKYYRSWGSPPKTNNTGNDCGSNGYYGDAKGMDLWALIRSDPPAGSLEVEIVDYADVVATASIPQSVAPDGTVVVAANFGNAGSSVANNVTYGIQLPSGLAGTVTCMGATCNYDVATGAVSISGLPTSLSAGQWTNAVTVQYTAPASGTLATSVAITTTSSQATPNAADSVSGSTVVTSSGTEADVLAQVTAPLTAAPGGVVNVAVSFRNLGPLTATGLGYAMELPGDLTGVSCAAPVTCSYDSATGAITVSGLPASLAASATASATLSYTAPGAGVVAVSATITTATAESSAANNTASAVTTVSAVASADVTAAIAPPAQAVGGTGVSVPMTFRNLGPQVANGVTYTVTLSTGLTGVSCSAPYSCSYDSGTGVVTLSGLPGTLQNGQIVDVTLAFTAPGTGTVSFSASLATSTTDNNPQNNSASAQTVLVPASYTVSFDSNGGSAVAALTNVTHGTAIAAPTPPTHVGYGFGGWYQEPALTNAWNFGTDTVTSATTLYARWQINVYTHTLTYTAGAHGSVTGTTSQTVNRGASGATVTAVADAGYHFVSWSDGVTTATRTDANVTGDLAVSASFVAGHALTYSASGQGTLTGAASQSVVHGGSGTAVTAVPNAGFEFFRWSDGVMTATRIDSNVDADLAVTAYFSRTEDHDLRRGGRQDFSILPGATLSRLRTTRGGQQTTVDDPTAADYAGLLNCSGTSCEFVGQRSGRHELTFIDPAGNAQVMVFDVLPNIGFSSERQSASAGTPVHVRVVLDDLPIDAALQVGYAVQNGAAIAAPDPVDLLTREPQLLTLNVGPGGNTQCFAAGHCSQEITFMPNTSTGEVRFTLLESAGAAIGDYAAHRVDLTSPALLPLTADLTLLPGSTVTTGTPLVASLVNLPAGNYRFDWSGSDAGLGIGSANTATVISAAGTAGSYLVRVTVQDLDRPNRAALELQTWVRVVASSDSARVCGAAGCDDDGTRIPFDLQVRECGLGLSDPAGAVAYRLQVGVKGWSWDTQGQCLETQPGYGLRLGSASFLSSPAYGAGIDAATVRQFGNNGREATNVADRAFTHTGLSYDFEVASLDTAGQSVAVVIPLPRDLIIPAGASWRTYQQVDGWTEFVTDTRNTLHSAPRSGAECPSPVSGVWEENPGLVAGMECVRLVIQDGGPNDADRKINAAVAAAGTLAVDVAREEVTVTSSGPKGGGGAMNPLTLLLALLLVLRRHARTVLGLVALAAMTTVHAEDVERPAGWSIGATAAQAMGEVDGGDVTRGLAGLGIPATARVDDQNRFGWRAFGGYRFGKYLSVDAGYANLGKATTHISGVPVDLEEIPQVLPASGAGWELSAAGYLPVSERVELYGRFGAWYWKTLYHALETGQKRRPDADGVDPLGGVGIRYRHPERWEAGLGWDRYRVDGQSVDLVGLSVIFRFSSQP